jgi:hypothetical protein
LIPSRIRKVLSTMANHRVRALLMGGQACVFYGAAEFSRDTDLLIAADPANLARLDVAQNEQDPYSKPRMRSNSLQAWLKESGMFGNCSPFLHAAASRSTN